jgi:competence protein ComFC
MAHLKDAVNAFFDLLLPRRERRIRTESRGLEDIPLSPTAHDLLGVRITTLMEYQSPAVEDLIRSLKYDGSSYAAKLAASLLADYLREEIASARTFSTRKILLIPVPLHKGRVRERGWNQTELVLRALPEEYRDGPLSYMVATTLTRTRATKPQTRLPRSERLSNVAGAFSLTAEAGVENTHVFLLDDVTTTGATLANSA